MDDIKLTKIAEYEKRIATESGATVHTVVCTLIHPAEATVEEVRAWVRKHFVHHQNNGQPYWTVKHPAFGVFETFDNECWGVNALAEDVMKWLFKHGTTITDRPEMTWQDT